MRVLAHMPPEFSVPEGRAQPGEGELAVAGGELSRLIGRPTTPIGDTVAAAFKRT
ncbi:hypothetical protein OG747_21035 [Streptomyces sp. NBC_01384]|uniref:hypothetical protein n=1 Tax=Streptomyces sp. NBC_01384 TaxID=2903847 RepID=UPI003244CE0D